MSPVGPAWHDFAPGPDGRAPSPPWLSLRPSSCWHPPAAMVAATRRLRPCPEPADDQAQSVGPAAPGIEGPLPAVDVVDVGSGATVSLTDYNTGQRPLLVWFWAPH